jgi:hypothetical protein
MLDTVRRFEGQRDAAAADSSPVTSVLQLRASRSRDSQAADTASFGQIHRAAERGVAGSASTLPYLARIQQAFGEHDVSSVRAHVGGNAASACDAIGAEAYASGNSVAFRGSPSLHTAAHEAAHVVQQRAGVHLKGGVGQAGDAWERHADAVADCVVAGRSAESLLGSAGGGGSAAGNAVQRQQAPGMSPDATVGGTTAAESDTNPVLALAGDFNNMAIYNAGEAPPDHQPATTVYAPYVLNYNSDTGAAVGAPSEAAAIKRLTIAEGRPSAGQTVGAAAGDLPFVGKGTPAQCQIISQAVVDSAFDGITAATLQEYINDGPSRGGGRQNGKWGVDCSGFTGMMMNELEGEEREGFNIIRSTAYRVGGGSGYAGINPRDAAMGDVIAFNSTNHVVVISQRSVAQLPQRGSTSTTRPAVKLAVAEATGSRDATSGHSVRTDRQFFYFDGASEVWGQTNPDGPSYRLAYAFGTALPQWDPVLGTVRYSAATDWQSGYTVFDSRDRNGANIRVRESDGRFTMTRIRIANGASGVEFREVEGEYVRVRFNGNDMQDGKEMWVPLRFVAQSGAGYQVPRQSGFDAGMFSVVRNPNITRPAPGTEGTGETTPVRGPQ